LLCAQNPDSTAVEENKLLLAGKSATDTLERDSPIDLEIGQLIIDNTFSKAGNDFQQIFNTKWTWPAQNAEQFIITISEKPSFVNSTIIEITINELVVFENFLQPRYDVIEETVDQAIGYTLDYILNYEDLVKQLGEEDLIGSGIY
jgi:curli production assembly/transport component CsgE